MSRRPPGVDINVTFSRSLLSEAHKLVKLHDPEIDLRTGAWTHHFHRDNWEFHGPAGFYWHGRADNGYEARYKGWMAWLRKEGAIDA